ncbi:MAG: DNA repair protein RadA [Armatimonadota bacterium]|nr:MAG: DNA repair protein RadA [Armatimonadota bacterium]
MRKDRIKYICDRCGAESPQWHGKCQSCGEWDALVEFRLPDGPPAVTRRAPMGAPVTATQVDPDTQARSPSGLHELDRVLGGGIVPGSLVLLAGDPGIGKSTLLLQAASSFAAAHGGCLYVTGEESLSQVAMRSRRLHTLSSRLLLLAESQVEAIAQQVEQTSPQLLIVDSVQAMYSSASTSLPGTVSQVRECTARLLSLAKSSALPTFLVGHVTKEGAVAGPRLLEHMVDTVLSLEGDRHSGYRLLRCVKNRFGSTDELGLFQMTENGLRGVPDASAALLAERRAGAPGSSVIPSLEGTRPLLVEIQALVARAAPHVTPRRSVTGLDYGRTCLVLAVLEKRAGIPLAGEDVFVNVPGGIRVTEPATDLGLALAVAGSYQDAVIRPSTACVGEVGLTGEIRAVPRLDRRLAELARHGFRCCVAPPGPQKRAPDGMQVIAVEDLSQAFRAAFSS